MAKTLTRAEAHQLIEDQLSDLAGLDGDLTVLLDIQQHWIGHRDYETAADLRAASDEAEEWIEAEAIAGMLHEYVDANASPQADRTPRGDDPTDLTNPEADEEGGDDPFTDLPGNVAGTILNDTDVDGPRMVQAYEAADPAARAVVDDIFISLCGWSLATLIQNCRPRADLSTDSPSEARLKLMERGL